MPELSLRRNGAVFSGSVVVGYVETCPRSSSHAFMWRLAMRSEALRGLPSGHCDSPHDGLERVVAAFRGWCAAAGLAEQNIVRGEVE